MNGETLFEAIGLMDEEFLGECLEVQVHKPKRILWETVLAAAVILSLTISAVAVVVMELSGRTGQGQQDLLIRWGTERYEGTVDTVDIYVTFPELHGTTEEIGAFYLPTIYEKEKLSICGVNEEDGIQKIVVGWRWCDVKEDAPAEMILYQQWSTCGYDPSKPLDTLQGLRFTESDIRTESLTYNGKSYFLVSVGEYEGEFGVHCGSFHCLYWTDGAYIYRLEFPGDMELTEAMEIIDSVQEVSDIQTWLEQGEARRLKESQVRWSGYVQSLSSDEPYISSDTFVGTRMEVLEDGDIYIWLQLSPEGNGVSNPYRLVYPRMFEHVEILEFGYTHRIDKDSSYQLVDYTVSWAAEEYGEDAEIWYRQRCRYDTPGSVNGGYEFNIYDIEDPAQVQTRTVQWGAYTIFEVSFEAGKDGAMGAKYYFWGDEFNAFSLRVPYAMEESVVQMIINSIG